MESHVVRLRCASDSNETLHSSVLPTTPASKSFNHGQTHPHYFDPKDLIQLAVQAVETIKSSTNNDSLHHSFDIVQFPMNPIEAYGIDVVHDLRIVGIITIVNV